MSKKFWKLENSVDSSGSTLYIEGIISSETWWGDEATPQQLRDELREITSDKLTVVLNSEGGDVFAGLAMYDALREHTAEVTVRVSGLAASIASVIAMAGDNIIMAPGSQMMIHKPSIFAMGNEEDLAKAIEILQKTEESIIPIYVDRTGLSKDRISEMLEAETWLTAEEAVAYGFADVMESAAKKERVNALTQLAINMKASKKAIEDSVHSLAETVKAQNEPADPPTEEVPEVETSQEETETDQETETVEEIESVEKEETMSKVEEPTAVAQAQVIEPSKQATPSQATPNANYLKTKESVHDYAQMLVKMAGADISEVKAAWSKHLANKGITMGVTNPEVLLPEPLVRVIEDAFEEGGEIWNLVNKTGLTAFRVTRDTVTGENSRAGGYNRADEATKREEVITLDDRVLRPQFIYKYITLNKEDIKENRDTNALVTYVLTELPRRIVREVERAIVIGDGRADGSDYKISSFISLKDDAADDPGVFAHQYTPISGEGNYETLVRARSLVKADGAKYLVAKTEFVTETLLQQGVNGGFLFTPGTNVGQVFGFSGVITPDWMDEDTDNDGYIFAPSAYTTVGDNSIEAFTNFLLSTNKQEYLQEIYAGGGLSKLDAAVAIGAAESS